MTATERARLVQWAARVALATGAVTLYFVGLAFAPGLVAIALFAVLIRIILREWVSD